MFQKLLITLILLFSIWPILVDSLSFYLNINTFGLSTVGAWGSQHGYAIVNFIVLYMIGAYIKCHVNENDIKMRYIVMVCLFCVILTYSWTVLDLRFCHKAEPDCAVAYNNPVVIALAASLLLMFKKMNFKNKIINSLAQGAFTCYLIHGWFIHHIRIDWFAQSTPVLLILHVIISSLGIFMISWIVHMIYNTLSVPVLRKIKFPVINILSA